MIQIYKKNIEEVDRTAKNTILRLRVENNINHLVSKFVHYDDDGSAICPICHSCRHKFYLLEDLQYFLCCNCIIAGDLVQFFEKLRGTYYNYSLKYLKDTQAITYSYIDRKYLPLNWDYLKCKNSIEEIFNNASKFYNKQLDEKTIRFLNKQGLSKGMIDLLLIGRVGQGDIADYLINEKKLNKELCATFLQIDEKEENIFKDGIVIPIIDYGNIIGLTYMNIEEPNIFERIWFETLTVEKGKENEDLILEW